MGLHMLEWSNQYETMTQKIGRTFKLLTLLGRLLEKVCQGHLMRFQTYHSFFLILKSIEWSIIFLAPVSIS